MKNNKKKIAVLSVMILLLAVSAGLNIFLNSKLNSATDTVADVNEGSVTETFSSFRSARTTTRQELLDYLDAIINEESSSVSAKSEAESQRLNVCKQMEDELLLERLISSRGFSDVIVTLSDNTCTVVVADNDLQSAEVAQILSIVTTETSYTANDVIVCPY